MRLILLKLLRRIERRIAIEERKQKVLGQEIKTEVNNIKQLWRKR